jgi:hypothetical protein
MVLTWLDFYKIPIAFTCGMIVAIVMYVDANRKGGYTFGG